MPPVDVNPNRQGSAAGGDHQQGSRSVAINELHQAARCGSAESVAALLSSGLIGIDSPDSTGWSPLMHAAFEGRTSVSRMLLRRGADLTLASRDDGLTALHLSAARGHVAVTVELLKAGANPGADAPGSHRPLHLAAQRGHRAVVAALVRAGAEVDSRTAEGATPLYFAASSGRADVVGELLRAKANPLLPWTCSSTGFVSTPLDGAVGSGHAEVVREMIERLGCIEGCGGPNGGDVALLRTAAEEQHRDIMAMLTGAGVVDTGEALAAAACLSDVASVKFLLQQHQRQQQLRPRRARASDGVGYVNFRGLNAETPLFRSIGVLKDKLCSTKVVRLLIDAGADTESPVRLTHTWGGISFEGTPLAFTELALRLKKVGGKDATEEQLRSIEGVRRLLLRVDAIRAVSWLWHSSGSNVPVVRRSPEGADTTNPPRTTRPPFTLTPTLPILSRRARRRGLVLTPLFR